MKRGVLGLVLISAVLVLTQRFHLAGAFLGNLASRSLILEWQTSNTSLTPFTCKQYVSRSAAESLLREALRWDSLNERIFLGIGRVAWLKGDCEGAESAWRQASLLAPHDEIIAFLIAKAQFARGDIEPALAFFDHIQYSEFFYQLGLQSEAAGQPQDAARWYEISFSITPARKYAQLLSAIYLNVKNDPEKALALWAELQQKTAPNEPDHWFAAGQAAEVRQDYGAALSAYQSGLQFARDQYETFLFCSQAAQNAERLKDISTARSLYEKALEAQPQLISSYLALSQLDLGQMRYEAALGWVERARKVDAASELPDYYAGLVDWQRGAKERAASAFERAHNRNPKNPLPSYYLALYAHDQHNLQQAIVYLQEAVSNQGGTMAGWLSLLTDWYIEAGNCKEALTTYMRVLEWEPENRLVQERLFELKEACP